ncbi:hypothetical protein C8Q74DRAFT_1448635 [Fomes fomentarius]|nr:hypothetical protein C8Q74DRAFT_1448635 [Fomes fomentarius]
MPGITRSMPLSSSSSHSNVSDALANLTKAATAALTAVHGAHEQAHEELARLREERDDAVKALHDVQLDAKDLEVRQEGWKAALEKSDLTIKHQTETITQLRAEVQQWKTQLSRLEDSSRQEIEGWKDQHRRAEHERSRLSARIEELVAGQLAWNAAAHAYTATAPFTPRMAYTNIEDPSSSSSVTKRASTSQPRRPGTPRATGSASHADEEDVPATTARKSRAPRTSRSAGRTERDRDQESWSRNGSPIRPATARRKNKDAAADAPQANGSRATPRTPAASRANVSQAQSQLQPRQHLIRRVTAVVDVKEEEDTDGGLDELESSASGSVYDPDDQPPIPPGGRRRRASNVSSRQKRVHEGYDDGDEDDGLYEDNGGNDGEGYETGDDELLLGPKTQTKKPPRTQAGAARQSRAGAGTKAAKKRKIDVDGGIPSGRAGPVKAAKTR